MRAVRSAILSAALFGGLLLAPAKAEAVTPGEWTGYYVGATHALCGLLDDGLLSRQYVKDILAVFARGNKDVPQRSVDKAFAMLRNDETVKNCPIPPRR